VTVTPGK